jgi:hypothetical protein
MPDPSVHTGFPGGRLGEYQWVAPGHLRAVIYREWDHQRVNTQATWYYFRLEGVRGVPLTLEITGLLISLFLRIISNSPENKPLPFGSSPIASLM